jgi:hypothetical protein
VASIRDARNLQSLNEGGKVRRDHRNEYAFEVELLAAVRVRASSESSAREAIPAALRAPSADVIRLANDANFVAGGKGIVTEVTFSTEEGSARLVEVDGKPIRQ